MVGQLPSDGMTKFVTAPLLFACLSALAQETGARNKFVGTWEARWKDQVICTIRLTPGEPVSGETDSCSIRVDGNGDLQEPESTGQPGEPTPILNARLEGETLTFEEKDSDEVIKFEFRLIGDRKAELRFPNAPVRINPIPFTRK